MVTGHVDENGSYSTSQSWSAATTHNTTWPSGFKKTCDRVVSICDRDTERNVSPSKDLPLELAAWTRLDENSAAMEYLIRFSQSHESFRIPELEALADLVNIKVEVVLYRPDVSGPGTLVCSLLIGNSDHGPNLSPVALLCNSTPRLFSLPSRRRGGQAHLPVYAHTVSSRAMGPRN